MRERKLNEEEWVGRKLEGGIPYIYRDGRVTLNRDAMEIQAYKYRVKNLKLQTARIILSSISILVAIAIFIFWVTRK